MSAWNNSTSTGTLSFWNDDRLCRDDAHNENIIILICALIIASALI
jgi:hypothetical protein